MTSERAEWRISEKSAAEMMAEIERLRAALKDLADAHELTISGEGYDPEHCDCPVLDRARRALA